MIPTDLVNKMNEYIALLKASVSICSVRYRSETFDWVVMFIVGAARIPNYRNYS